MRWMTVCVKFCVYNLKFFYSWPIKLGISPLKDSQMHKTINPSTRFTDLLNAHDLIQLKAAIFDTPEAVQAKVQLIKEELAAGRYQINSANVAEKLLEFAPEHEETVV
jgi:anti-sigma28 factor (negative regulator of flagellin synthesis)